MPVNQELYQEGQVILIDKDYQWTSFDVVKKIRGSIRIKKVGHAGTLDPLATGLLIVCTGKKTKEIQNFQDLPKSYEGTFYLGAIRPSHDKETEITERKPVSDITNEQLVLAARSFEGEIMQVPPSFSAIKKDGKRLYEFAREGKKIKVDPRSLTVYSFNITNINLPFIDFQLKCSKGFYVRSLARDLGKALGCGAYLESLRRTGIGDINVEEALTISEFVRKLEK